MLGNRRSRDMTKYCQFHIDHREQKWEKQKTSNTQQGEWKKGDKDTTPTEALILMISKRDHIAKRKSLEELTLRVDSKVPLVGFFAEHSWPIKEVHLEITIGTKKLSEVSLKDINGILSCTDTEERIILNSEYPKQTVIIGKQLPTNFKERLQDLLRFNVNVFAWIYADMTGIPRTIIVGGKPFNTEHKLKEYKHIKPVKQKKSGLGPNRNTTSCKEVEELIKAGILQKVKNQTWVANPIMVKKSDGESICVVLLVEREERQVPIYFISRVLQGVELNYPALEKLILALVHAVRRYEGRMAKWAIKLGEHDIKFKECGSVQKHIPNDFSVEMSSEEGEKIMASKIKTKKEKPKLNDIWKLYTMEPRSLTTQVQG
uniref:Reverse transcriptase RNase H-like domain-containing protein n=1 Tax=Tanacetum cinerariifolium TaxID=118510 RepID=A0A6L2KHW8_TANCI|nr:hypothetical protein [Tanacetum cinerariifolium]